MNDASAGSAPPQHGVMLEPHETGRPSRWDIGGPRRRDNSPVDSGPIEDVAVPPGFGYEQFVKREPEDMERDFVAFPRDEQRLQAQPYGYSEFVKREPDDTPRDFIAFPRNEQRSQLQPHGDDDDDSDDGSSSSDDEVLLPQPREQQKSRKRRRQPTINMDLVMLDEEEGGVPLDLVAMGPLPTDHPSQTRYLQTPISQLQNHDYLWQLPVQEIHWLQGKDLKSQFRNQPLALLYHKTCAGIRQFWKATSLECIPEGLRAKTPYSLALFSKLRCLALHTQKNYSLAQDLLQRAHNERHEHEGSHDHACLQIVEIAIDAEFCERAIEENVHGLTYADAEKAISWAKPHEEEKHELKRLKKLKKRLRLGEKIKVEEGQPEAEEASLVAGRITKRRRAKKELRSAERFPTAGRKKQMQTEPASSIAQRVIGRRLENRFATLGVDEPDTVPESMPETTTFAIPFRPAPGTDSTFPTEPPATQQPAKHPLQIMAEHREILQQGGDGAEHIKQLMKESRQSIKEKKREQQGQKDQQKDPEKIERKKLKKEKRKAGRLSHQLGDGDTYRPSYNSMPPPQATTTDTYTQAFVPPTYTMGMFPQDFAHN